MFGAGLSGEAVGVRGPGVVSGCGGNRCGDTSLRSLPEMTCHQAAAESGRIQGHTHFWGSSLPTDPCGAPRGTSQKGSSSPGSLDQDTLGLNPGQHLPPCPPASLSFLPRVLSPRATLQGYFWETSLPWVKQG